MKKKKPFKLITIETGNLNRKQRQVMVQRHGDGSVKSVSPVRTTSPTFAYYTKAGFKTFDPKSFR